MNKFRFFLLVCIVAGGFMAARFSPAFGAGPKGATYQFTVTKQGSMIADPSYYCWIPESVGTVCCIIVHQHGCTTEGSAEKQFGDVQWITLAKKWHAAFVSPRLTTGSVCSNWSNCNNGSGNCFLDMLDTLAKMSGHPEVSIVPWALWGHSGGAGWVTQMTGKYPLRVVATIAQSCGSDISRTSAALKVPILHHNGTLDLCHNDSIFIYGRRLGALWAHAINPDVPVGDTMSGHGVHDMRLFAIPWLDVCLSKRLPLQAGTAQLRDMDTSRAWLGNKATKEIASQASYTGNKLAACWFPDSVFAKKWAEYMVRGHITDSTPADAPYNLSGTYRTRVITLNWDSDADLEDGIKTFAIYRNGAFLKKVRYTTITGYDPNPGFQRWEFCDEPNPSPAPAMTVKDTLPNDTGTYQYQIACVNWSDVTGNKSIALTLKDGQISSVLASANMRTVEYSKGPVRMSVEIGRLYCGAGTIGIFDMQGRLLKTARVQRAGWFHVKNLLGKSAEKVVILKTL
jgi:hypothetical protein